MSANRNESANWAGDLDTALPIRGSDIPGFTAWVNCNGFRERTLNDRGHDGFDFGAFLRGDGTIVVGLPKDTPIRAVADGVVKRIRSRGIGGGYICTIDVEHGESESGLLSAYVHTEPSVEEGATVSKGEVLGTLYSDMATEPEPTYGRLVHLHLSLIDAARKTESPGGYDTRLYLDPGEIDPSIYTHTTVEQGWEHFDPRQIIGAMAVEVANFDIVDVNGHRWQNM